MSKGETRSPDYEPFLPTPYSNSAAVDLGVFVEGAGAAWKWEKRIFVRSETTTFSRLVHDNLCRPWWQFPAPRR